MKRKLDKEKIKKDVKTVLVNIWPLYVYILGGLISLLRIEIYGRPEYLRYEFIKTLDIFILHGSATLVLLGLLFVIYLVPKIIFKLISKARKRYFEVYR